MGQVVHRFQNTPKLKGEVSTGFLDLAQDRRFCEAAGQALFTRFGKVTVAQAKKGALEHFEKAMSFIRAKDVSLGVSNGMVWSYGGRDLARGITADCINP